MDRWSRRFLFITVTPRKRFPIPEGEEEDTIVGVGNYLTSLLSEKYGYQVIHIKEAFDMMSGELDRNKAIIMPVIRRKKVLEEIRLWRWLLICTEMASMKTDAGN